ncbi:uncharacterized protein LOC121738732 [Aricia agestis]|uniref:uncharacterized protein LOC121738732 n=1 Tax=Aricia agestis TaxID=91739 RepID=UPI001C202B2E|nr:uncharacterized protein LOC121738732 [Aricia agestis]
MLASVVLLYSTWILKGVQSHMESEIHPVTDEMIPAWPDDEPPKASVLSGLMSDSFAEMFNILDGDSFGIGPMHEFVYGWQAIVNTMSMKNNVEVRKRAGLQRFALAGINGISLISHIGVTEIMINGTRTYCFGGVSRPPGRRSVICKGATYQEGRFSCKTPYLRYPTALGYMYCIDRYAAVNSLDGTEKTTYCSRGESVPKFHYDYICERRDIKIKRVNLTDPNERFNIRNPIVRRVEYYRAPNDILKYCPDWYGCNLNLSPDMNYAVPLYLLDANDTAFVGHGGKYWLALYNTQLSTYATYFQAHSEYPWGSSRPIVTLEKGGIWEQLLKANIGPDMNLHYNLNGIYNRYGGGSSPDLMRNDGQVQPSNFRTEVRDGVPEDMAASNAYPKSGPIQDPAAFQFVPAGPNQ